MRLVDVAKEIVYPLTDAGIVLAIITFWLLGSLARAAGLLGLWLAFVLLPAFFRYALYLLEARALGQHPPVLGIELFNWVENMWSLFPLIIVASFAWLAAYLFLNVSVDAALLAVALMLLLMPLCMGMLGLTHSPLACLNPGALFRLAKTIGGAYLWVPAITMAAVFGLVIAVRAGMPSFAANLAAIYVFFLMFSMTGATLRAHRIDLRVDIPDALAPQAVELAERRVAERQKIANHAYGFVSRGNRQGGLQHIESWLKNEDLNDDAWYWFFNEMLTWESSDAALHFAQVYLRHLLVTDQNVEALKLLSRCLRINAAFRPHADDAAATNELLRQYERNDLLKQLNANKPPQA